MKARGWCFTINNYTWEDIENVVDLSNDYLIFGFEEGKKGTPHIQGYVYLQKKITRKALSVLLPNSHLESAIASSQKNKTYCSKEGLFFEFGEPRRQGTRTDLCRFANDAVTLSDRALFEMYPSHFLRYGRSLGRIRELQRESVPVDERQYLTISDNAYLLTQLLEYKEAGYTICMDMNTYVDEDVCIIDAYNLYNPSFNADAWQAGFDVKIKRGFEIILMMAKIVIYNKI